MSYRVATEWMAAVRREVESAVDASGGGVAVAYTGGPAFLTEVANGMESDLRTSVAATLGMICLLFWVAHRTFRPLALLVASLGLTLVLALGTGGLLLGHLSVISCGFAAVMLGLVVDYGLVGYQEFRANPEGGLDGVRGRVLPGIAWSAVTTAGTFLSLGWVGIPGLGELGVMTAIGLGWGAVVMVGFFLPRVVGRDASLGAGGKPERPMSARTANPRRSLAVPLGGALLVGGFLLLVVRGLPEVETGAAPLRPRRSAAHEAMSAVQRELAQETNPVWVLFPGESPDQVAELTEATRETLEVLVEKGEIRGYRLPTEFWPRPRFADANREVAARIAGRLEELEVAARSVGFSTASMELARRVLGHWKSWGSGATNAPLWPVNDGAAWMRELLAGRTRDGGWVGLGTVQPRWPGPMRMALPKGVIVTGWDQLGPDLLGRVGLRVALMMLGTSVILVACLWLAFRRWTEVFLSIGALGLSFLILLVGMSVLGARWNLLNLVALPLLLGTSVDSTIHIQLALRREGGCWQAVWRSTGRALLLCAGANVAGFGSLAWSSNAGLASLDLVCAGGVGCVLFVALGLLPGWWQAVHGGTAGQAAGAGASRLYAEGAWRLGSGVARRLPRGLLVPLARCLALVYAMVRPSRLDRVTRNLLPLVGGDRSRARAAARANFQGFGVKLVDLWRWEAGVPGEEMVETGEGWAAYHEAVSAGRGVLLVTVHLGNWEAGAEILRRTGVRPLVLTASEPSAELTDARAGARSRRGVDTLVVGADPFAFVTVIRRLQDGGVVALLMDRPLPGTGVEVGLLGGRIQASPAVAELARATGATVLPVFVVLEGQRYRAHALPIVAYDRASLGDRRERVVFTERVLRVFEPVLRQHPEQWYHFVSVWKEEAG